MTNSVVIEPGQPVMTMDGKKVGTVKDVRGNFFKVGARFRPDFWLDQDTVAESGGIAQLSLTKDDLGAYKLARPEAVATTSSADLLMSDEEMAAQRERMERELLQRK